MKRDDSLKKKREGFQASNLECAAIILSDPQTFGGHGSLMVDWATLVLSRQYPQANLPELQERAA